MAPSLLLVRRWSVGAVLRGLVVVSPLGIVIVMVICKERKCGSQAKACNPVLSGALAVGRYCKANETDMVINPGLILVTIADPINIIIIHFLKRRYMYY
jgi:hypothetical protein